MVAKISSPTKPRLGCGFLVASAVVTCVFLAINGLIVMNLVNAVLPTLPSDMRDHRVAQGIVFLGPLALLVVEWWVFDVAMDWLRPIDDAGKGNGRT